ncbi:MAG TPA: nucleoside-diphosphate sugar epimerase/dehydratase [Acidimicrobiales bacterium]|nr:nucleoside-diphosphate sugar epimerase/dehydratase [Acidimicrobiales bacterium]
MNAARAEALSPSALFRVLGRRRALIQGSIDALSWVVGLTAALAVRYDLTIPAGGFADLAQVVPLAVTTQVVAGLLFHLYRGRWRYGSFDEVQAVVASAAATGAVVGIVNLTYLERQVPGSVPFGGAIAALVLMAGWRYVWRLVLDRRRRPDPERAERLVVFGAGEGGAQVVTSLLRDRDSAYVPVALVDDDPEKVNLRILGVPVLGGSDDLAAVAAHARATHVLLAIPSADAELVRRTQAACLDAGLTLHVVPTPAELVGRTLDAGQIRAVTIADLLGRRELDTDVGSIAGYLTNKRVLVTGAGGSIGSELCRQIAKWGPSELVLLDRDESALHAVQLSLEGRALLDRPNLVVADIRDRARVREVFATWRPEVVFHAAALKHLPLLEMHPEEAIKTNVYATQHVLDAAIAFDVDRFVNVSTDKAADPVSILGYTKRIAERLTARAAERTDGTFLSVRFGNVLGSRGSVLHAFQAQVAAGGPITVTHPDVTRFFMTIEEAVQLLVQAGAIGRNGEALVLDMGEPVRILEVARQLAAAAPEPIEIEFTGLRLGEKLHEQLWGTGEADHRPIHPLVSHVVVPPLHPHELHVVAEATGAPLTRLALVALCGMSEAAAVTGPAAVVEPRS